MRWGKNSAATIKITGRAQAGFDVKLPTALAIDGQGRDLGRPRAFSSVSVFSPDGKLLAKVLHNLGEIVALAFDPSGRLVVADSAAGQIYTYDVTGNRAQKVAHIRPESGRRAIARRIIFFCSAAWRSIQPDIMVTIQTEPAGGAARPLVAARKARLGAFRLPSLFPWATTAQTIPRCVLFDDVSSLPIARPCRRAWEYTGEMLAPSRPITAMCMACRDCCN